MPFILPLTNWVVSAADYDFDKGESQVVAEQRQRGLSVQIFPRALLGFIL